MTLRALPVLPQRRINAIRCASSQLDSPIAFRKWGIALTRIALLFLTILCSVGFAASDANAQSFVAQYSRPKTQNFDRFNRELQRKHVLENIAKGLSRQISLPMPVVITIAECGQANAFYNPQYRAVVLCYELFGEFTYGIQRSFQSIASPQEIYEATSGGLSFIFIHELGHALISVLDLPILGREEDAADQIAAYLLLQSPGNSPSYAVAGALWFFRSNTLFYTRRHFSDEHSLGPQRQSNLACWAYGKDPVRYQHLLTGKYLTPERASRCGAEYQKLDTSVRKLLGNNVRLADQ
jgi:hypothetical protein